jgi:hypothetical protein
MHVDARRKLIVKDSHGERDVLLVGTLTVGRDPGCEISVADPLLSRHHAEFVESSSGVMVRDLHSQNGIKVNNVVVKEAALQAGDIVQIAGITLRYVEEAAPPLQNQDVAAEPVKDDRTMAMPSPPTFSQPLPPPDAPPPPRPAEPPAELQDPGTNPMVPPPRHASAPPAVATPAGQESAAPAQSGLVGNAAPPRAASAATDDPDERTRAMAPPVMAKAPQPPSPPPAAAPAARTPVKPAPAPAPVAPAKPAKAAKAAKDAKAGEADDAVPRAARAARSSWGARVLWQVLILSLVISLGSAAPLMMWHNQQMNAVGESRATAVVNWLAADAATAISTGKDVTLSTEQVAAEPGVVSARVLMPDGRVIAPAARSAERVEYIPGVEATPADVLRVRTGWNGDQLEIVKPVSANGNPRAAIAWVTIRPTSEFGGSSAAVTAPIVLVSVLIGWIVAVLITRSTMRSLNALNEDVELALSGRLDAVADPLGARPVRDLADTISYLVARLRGSGIDTSRDRTPHPALSPQAGRGKDSPQAARSTPSPRLRGEGGGEGPVSQSPSPNPSAASASAGIAAPAAPRASASAAAPKVLEARLIANASFVVTEAGPGCADVLGVRSDALVGKHLLDAILDTAIAEAVLGCFGNLPAEGERQATVADGQGRQLDVRVSRAGKDKPIAVVIRVERAS